LIIPINFEQLYRTYNKRKYVHPDPVECLFCYHNLCDREIAAFVASALAYGNVRQILKSVASVLDPMGPSPSTFLFQTSTDALREMFKNFSHRFATGEHLAEMLLGLKHAVKTSGSLYHCFLENFRIDDETILPALTLFVKSITDDGTYQPGHLIPLPERGSACKRLNLFLRWLVRSDEVDPGGWDGIPGSRLIVPLDTHMHRICLSLGFTKRRQADMRTALEITTAFKKIVPEDPARYDFSLTRFGIRKDMKWGEENGPRLKVQGG